MESVKSKLLPLTMIIVFSIFLSNTLLFASSNKDSVGDFIIHEVADNTEYPFVSFPINIGDFSYTFKITKHMIILTLVAIICMSMILYLAHKLKNPFKRPTLFQNILEIIIEYLDKNVLGVTLGAKGREYLPFCLTMFFFILIANFVGLIPAVVKLPTENGAYAYIAGAITANLSITGALAVISFLTYNIAGMRKKGIIKYWLSLVPHGVPVFVAPVIWLIEFIGLFTRGFSLAIRLFANMTGGHIMIIVIPFLIIIFGTVLVSPFAIAFLMFIYLLEMFVSVVQAYVFSFLTAVFISLAIEDH